MRSPVGVLSSLGLLKAFGRQLQGVAFTERCTLYSSAHIPCRVSTVPRIFFFHRLAGSAAIPHRAADGVDECGPVLFPLLGPMCKCGDLIDS